MKWQLNFLEHPIAEFVVDPEIDKEICEVVNMNDKVEVARDGGFCNSKVGKRHASEHSEKKQASSNLDRLHV